MERKKGKKKGKQDEEVPAHLAGDKANKVMNNVAKYLRNKVPCKKTKFLHHTVDYFIASVAVDCILESPWGSEEGAKKNVLPRLETREVAEEYLQRMLELKFFHRARKVPITERDLRRKALKKFKEETEAEKKKKKSEEDEESGGEDDKGRSAEEESGKETEKKEAGGSAGKNTNNGNGDKAKRRRIKLEMHLEQVFVDGKDAYVWIYESTPWYYWILSTILVIATVGLCLFPLWPSTLRLGVYYLSIAAGGFLLSILCLALLKWVIFVIIWVLSIGKHHLWILPNLTEDVGFFASFWPLYKYEYKGPTVKVKKKKEKADKEKEKASTEDNPPPERITSTDDKLATDDVSRKGSSDGSNGNGSECNEFEILDKPSTEEDEEE